MRQIKAIFPQSKSRLDLIQKLWNKPDFKKAVAKIRNKWKINTKFEFEMYEANWISENQEILLGDYHFMDDLIALQKKFKLGEQWSCYLQEYVFNDLVEHNKTNNFFIEKRTGNEADPITGEPVYYLRIFPETTQTDITKSWTEINNFIHESNKKPRRQKLSKKMERDSEIFKLAKAGVKVEDIDSIITNKYKRSMDYGAIKTAESRYRKKMGINKSNKLGYKKPIF